MKIGMIAMSGVRAHNEELTKLGLTLPGHVFGPLRVGTEYDLCEFNVVGT